MRSPTPINTSKPSWRWIPSNACRQPLSSTASRTNIAATEMTIAASVPQWSAMTSGGCRVRWRSEAMRVIESDNVDGIVGRLFVRGHHGRDGADLLAVVRVIDGLRALIGVAQTQVGRMTEHESTGEAEAERARRH